jgi:hypothetical protein
MANKPTRQHLENMRALDRDEMLMRERDSHSAELMAAAARESEDKTERCNALHAVPTSALPIGTVVRVGMIPANRATYVVVGVGRMVNLGRDGACESHHPDLLDQYPREIIYTP